VILASNLKDNIDAAFTRRFHVTIHFPRPEPRERWRLWEIAFPPGAPLDESLALDALTRLDLTGAGIADAARTAALMAVADGSATISKRHLAQALARQYQREARVLIANELGPYASHLGTET
jgi:SpoVK/Ycf46/Vps4 family AAA+-type ATPase